MEYLGSIYSNLIKKKNYMFENSQNNLCFLIIIPFIIDYNKISASVVSKITERFKGINDFRIGNQK